MPAVWTIAASALAPAARGIRQRADDVDEGEDEEERADRRAHLVVVERRALGDRLGHDVADLRAPALQAGGPELGGGWHGGLLRSVAGWHPGSPPRPRPKRQALMSTGRMRE